LIRSLEAKGALNRAIEFLPDDKALAERAQQQRGLTPPEISVLLAYTKIALKESILASPLPDAAELQPLLIDYFPPALLKKCGAQITTHALKREIVTTQLVNRLVNRMGTTFVTQIGDETGAGAAQAAAAWFAASELLDAETAWHEIEALDLKIPAAEQLALMARLREMVGAATRQILAARPVGVAIGETLERYRAALGAAIAEARQELQGAQAVAALLGARNEIVKVFELVDQAHAGQRPLSEVAAISACLDATLDLGWLGTAIERLPAGNRWQARARAQLAGELRSLRQKLLQTDFREPQTAVREARRVVDELRAEAPQDLAMLSAGLAEIRRLLVV
jgi:glutamate dehydrogenase